MSLQRCRFTSRSPGREPVIVQRCGRSRTHAHNNQLYVCENRTCKKQGSRQILKILEDIESEGHGISARGCGCLGSCGAGPNVAVNGVNVSGIGTPAAIFRMLREHCSVEVSDGSQLSVQLRLRGNDLASQGQHEAALETYREALQYSPAPLAYKIHSNMSLLALTMGDVATALSEASLALAQAPRDFTTAKIRMVEACLAAHDGDAAGGYLNLAVREDNSFRKSVIFRELERKVEAAGTC